jgi:phosphoribosylformimino-5-aminoimidazole carboxamide ribotide isomerase
LPITSLLTKSSKPIDIVKAFMDFYPFKTLYIADLNAIQQVENTSNNHLNIISQIKHTFPDLKLWIDAGVNTSSKAKTWTTFHAQLVLGSESFQTLDQYQSVVQQLSCPFTLSLDFLPQGYTGPKDLLQHTEYWPKDIIVMTLAKVGANIGADLQALKQVMAKTKQHHFYAAGGIRNIKDLLHLKQLGINGALLATSLHHQQITANELQMLAI